MATNDFLNSDAATIKKSSISTDSQSTETHSLTDLFKLADRQAGASCDARDAAMVGVFRYRGQAQNYRNGSYNRNFNRLG